MVLMACLKVPTDGEFLIVAGMLFHATIVVGREEYLQISILVLICRMLLAVEPRVLLVLVCCRWRTGTSTMWCSILQSMMVRFLALRCSSGSHPSWCNMLYILPGRVVPGGKSGCLALNVLQPTDQLLLVGIPNNRCIFQYWTHKSCKCLAPDALRAISEVPFEKSN